jgi:hypothetical protein
LPESGKDEHGEEEGTQCTAKNEAWRHRHDLEESESGNGKSVQSFRTTEWLRGNIRDKRCTA